VFTKNRVAVFVDGCFWHCCPVHGATPKANAAYWGPKLARNRERDHEVTLALEKENWIVVRVWEHELSTEAAVQVIDALRCVSGPLRAESTMPDTPRGWAE
jgi:DNA mismatch endonuclease (patch repair protein)